MIKRLMQRTVEAVKRFFRRAFKLVAHWANRMAAGVRWIVHQVVSAVKRLVAWVRGMLARLFGPKAGPSPGSKAPLPGQKQSGSGKAPGRSARKGSAMVEFALVAPLLILVLLGIMVMGVMINAKIVVAGAAREAGRTWAIYKQDGTARERAADAIRDGGLKWAADGKSFFEPSRDVRFTRRGADWIEVTVTYKQPAFVPLIAELIDGVGADGLVTLRSTAIFKVER